jgi:hypothetical protein
MTVPYLRVMFTAYWDDESPSTELFYLVVPPTSVNLAGIAKLEAAILSVLKAHTQSRAQRLIYLGNTQIDVTEAEINALTWRIVPGLDLSGTHE